MGTEQTRVLEDIHFPSMASPASSPMKAPSPRKPVKLVDIASLRDGDRNFLLETKVTSISGARSFGTTGAPDDVFLNLTLMDASGWFSSLCMLVCIISTHNINT